jgi:hypothetical protein
MAPIKSKALITLKPPNLTDHLFAPIPQKPRKTPTTKLCARTEYPRIPRTLPRKNCNSNPFVSRASGIAYNRPKNASKPCWQASYLNKYPSQRGVKSNYYEFSFRKNCPHHNCVLARLEGAFAVRARHSACKWIGITGCPQYGVDPIPWILSFLRRKNPPWQSVAPIRWSSGVGSWSRPVPVAA